MNKKDAPLKKLNVRIYESDYERLRLYFPSSYNEAIRSIVHRRLNELDKAAAKALAEGRRRPHHEP